MGANVLRNVADMLGSAVPGAYAEELLLLLLAALGPLGVGLEVELEDIKCAFKPLDDPASSGTRSLQVAGTIDVIKVNESPPIELDSFVCWNLLTS